MKRYTKIERARLVFSATFVIILLCMLAGVVKTNKYNEVIHNMRVNIGELQQEDQPVTVEVVVRSDKWTKIFDLENEGLEEPNYDALIYDFTVNNNTNDQIDKFSFNVTFDDTYYMQSAWNGSLEVHQTGKTDTIPDLREYKPENHNLNYVTIEGENFLQMKDGEWFTYWPSSSANAMEVPIEAREATTPGFIMYVPIGTSLDGCYFELSYRFHRQYVAEPLFWMSALAMFAWCIAMIVYNITKTQMIRYEERHERDNEIINESIETFTGFIDAKDPYTNGHSKRVAKYTRMIAEKMGYKDEELDRIYYVALLHDCGKIGVPDNILGKPGKLTPEEFEIIKSHTTRGGQILNAFKSLEDVNEGALYHHERYDGTGYPEGRKGEDIPLIARMICVADSFDAMNTNRVYRNKLTKEKIISELKDNEGKQFDPKIAEVMLELIDENKINMDELKKE